MGIYFLLLGMPFLSEWHEDVHITQKASLKKETDKTYSKVFIGHSLNQDKWLLFLFLGYCISCVYGNTCVYVQHKLKLKKFIDLLCNIKMCYIYGYIHMHTYTYVCAYMFMYICVYEYTHTFWSIIIKAIVMNPQTYLRTRTLPLIL